MKEDQVDEQMMSLVEDAFTDALRTERIILSRAERWRLFRAVLEEIFDDMLSRE
jgi:hypothetical protein